MCQLCYLCLEAGGPYNQPPEEMHRVLQDLLLQQGVPGGTLEENADSDQGGCTLYVQAGHAEGGGFQM